MGFLRVRKYKGSFTVEAVFVMPICIAVLFGILYLSMYCHDYVVMYSLGQNYLEMVTENGKKADLEKEASKCESYIQKQLLICDNIHVSFQKKWMSMEGEIQYKGKTRIPFLEPLLQNIKEGQISLYYGDIHRARRMWNGEENEN